MDFTQKSCFLTGAAFLFAQWLHGFGRNCVILNSFRKIMVGFIQKGKRALALNEAQFATLCAEIEREFDIKQIRKQKGEVLYTLEAGVNKMRWVDASEIKLLNGSDCVLVEHSISTAASMVIVLLISAGFFVYQMLEKGEILFGLLPFVIFLPLMLLLALIAGQVFKFRINNLINRITTDNYSLTDQQREWVSDPAKCPACGYGIEKRDCNCPDCGLRLN